MANEHIFRDTPPEIYIQKRTFKTICRETNLQEPPTSKNIPPYFFVEKKQRQRYLSYFDLDEKGKASQTSTPEPYFCTKRDLEITSTIIQLNKAEQM